MIDRVHLQLVHVAGVDSLTDIPREICVDVDVVLVGVQPWFAPQAGGLEKPVFTWP